MASYPNRDALRDAHDIYLNAMKSFIFKCLKESGAAAEEKVIEIEDTMEIADIPHFVNRYWERSFEQYFTRIDRYYEVRGVTWVIKEGRNRASHPPWDLDTEFTRTHLFLMANLLEKIDRPDAKSRVENVQDQLFSNNTARQTEEVEQATYKKRLETMSTQLARAVAEKAGAEERLSDMSNRFGEAERENAAYKKRVETISNQLEAANAEKTKYEKAVKAASNQLATLKSANAKLEEHLETTSTRLADVEAELDACKKRLPPEPLPLNSNTPDSVTFQGTTFTKRLNKYRVKGDAITQSFWRYWHSLGPEGKEEMRDAGWSVEKIDDDYWEITISPEDFEAWVEEDDESLGPSIQLSSALTESIRPSYERTSLPTVKEMVQPALELLADRKEHRRVEMINLLTEHFSLDDDERRDISRTGKVEKHLMSEELIERTRTGYYRITDLGLEILKRNSGDVPF